MLARLHTCEGFRASEMLVGGKRSPTIVVLLAAALVSILALIACGDGGAGNARLITESTVAPPPVDNLTPVGEPGVEPTANARPAREPTADGPGRRASGRVLEVTVGPSRKECYGPFRRMCLIVDGQFFYDEIEGFNHEPGYRYRLKIEEYDAFPGQKEPPQDAGLYAYRLLEIVSKSRAAGDERIAVVSPARITCPKSDQTCMLVDGTPFRGAIAGFEFEAGFDYLIRFEEYEDGSRQLLEVIDKTPAESTVEEIEVGPWRVQCYANAPITAACIVVNGEPYYGLIEEFPRAHGYEYRLRVEKYDLIPNLEFSPDEQPKYGYRLREILSEAPASPPQTN